MHEPDIYLFRASSFGFIFRCREDAAKFRPIEVSMSLFLKAKFALCFLVLLAVATVSAQTTAIKPGPTGTGTTPAIVYNGGPVMTGNPVNVYLIWYGNWNASGSDTPYTQNLVEHFLSTFGGSQLALVNTLYNDPTGNVSGNYLLGGPAGTASSSQAFSSTFDSTGSTSNAVKASTALTSSTNTTTKIRSKNNISDNGVEHLVANTINNGQLPRDPNGVYFVLTSSDISESSGFCGDPSKGGYCGWHSHSLMGGVDIKYAFVGNPDRCVQIQSVGQCEIQQTGPNSPAVGIGGADGMVNVIAHELSESTTDPDENAWFNSLNEENADVCNFNFGLHSLCGTGSLCTDAGNFEAADYNQTFGNNNWMLQQLGEPNQSPPACVQHL
jgi:hypothetical protein